MAEASGEPEKEREREKDGREGEEQRAAEEEVCRRMAGGGRWRAEGEDFSEPSLNLP